MSLEINPSIFLTIFQYRKGAIKEKNKAIDEAASERRKREKLEKKAREDIKLLRNQWFLEFKNRN